MNGNANNNPHDFVPEDGKREAPVPPDDPEAQRAIAEGADDIHSGNPPEDLATAQQPSPFERLMARLRGGVPSPTRDAKAMEKSRGLVLLAVTLIGGIFLFFGLFTTDSTEVPKTRPRDPNLGRPHQKAVNPEGANRSALPQLSVDTQQPDDSGDLTEKDVLGTMRNQKQPSPDRPVPQQPAGNLGQIGFDDPTLADAYRRQGRTPPPQTVTTTEWNQAITEFQAQQANSRTLQAAQTPAPKLADELKKSSIVFVRTGTNTVPAGNGNIRPVLDRNAASALSRGTTLVARLQHAVSSVAKVPVVAVIEYNYERDGQLIVPAGTRAYGQLSEASPQGYVGIKFETLEFPDGRREEIAGSALSMERGVLKGDVNGRNTGKKFLTRAATGLGTIAAYVMGGRGVGSANGIDSTILLRERLASNIAMAGEQQLAMMAYQQNIVVTVPANTRFYLVLHEDKIERRGARDATIPGDGARESGSVPQRVGLLQEQLSPEEIRDLRQLRNEMRQVNQMLLNPQPSRPDGR